MKTIIDLIAEAMLGKYSVRAQKMFSKMDENKQREFVGMIFDECQSAIKEMFVTAALKILKEEKPDDTSGSHKVD